MLVLGRRLNERIMIDGGRIVVEVVDVRPDGRVRLGVTAPREVSVHREEVQAEIDRGRAAEKPGMAGDVEGGCRPKVITLCGSTRFADEYRTATRDETLKGVIVISVGLFGHQEGLDMAGETKRMLDELHLRKIDLSDEILVINPGGYVGESTRREIAYAERSGKPVRYLHPAQVEYRQAAAPARPGLPPTWLPGDSM